MSPLLKVVKIAINHLSLGLSPQPPPPPPKKKNSRAKKFIRTIDKKSVAVVVLEESA